MPTDARPPDRGAADLVTPARPSTASPQGVATAMEAVDIGRAANTIPLVVGPGAETSPAVAPELWIVHVRYERSPTPALGAALVEEYTSFALALARRWRPRAEPVDDVDHAALVALIGALDRFECGRCTPFPRFAVPIILGALKRQRRATIRGRAEIDQLGRDLERLAATRMAEGIFMTRSQMTESQARNALVHRSQCTDRDLHLVAADVIAEQDQASRDPHPEPHATGHHHDAIDTTPSAG